MKKKARPHNLLITIPDPDETPVSAHATQGGILEWRSDALNYPQFQIRFVGPNPENSKADQSFSGKKTKPVVLHLKRTGTFKYRIVHKHGNGGKDISSDIHTVGVRSCRNC